jgi:hypothetical protein
LYLFVIDPGTRTGIAWGSVSLAGGSVRDALSECQVQSLTFEGDTIDQAMAIERQFYEFMYKDRDQPHKPIHVIVEDFILRKMTSDRELLDPVRVATAFLTILRSEYQSERYDVTYQQPSAMASITSDRLRLWNLWIRGSDPALEHQRDARRHFAAYVAGQVRVSSSTG